jgi:hypothetical protein
MIFDRLRRRFPGSFPVRSHSISKILNKNLFECLDQLGSLRSQAYFFASDFLGVF